MPVTPVLPTQIYQLVHSLVYWKQFYLPFVLLNETSLAFLKDSPLI